MARKVGHSESLAWALLGKSLVHQARRESELARASSEELIDVCKANELVMQPALARLIHGWALAVDGDPGRGCAEIRDGFYAFSAPGLVLMETHGHVMLADGYRCAGNGDQGLLSLDEPLTTAKSEERIWSAELFRIRGELLLLQADSHSMHEYAKSDILFRQAIEIARSQQAKALELRATTSLARILAKQDRCTEARAMLADIYGWFTEGLDTADQKDAKAVLDKLTA
jgi:hypothetical protein